MDYQGVRSTDKLDRLEVFVVCKRHHDDIRVPSNCCDLDRGKRQHKGYVIKVAIIVLVVVLQFLLKYQSCLTESESNRITICSSNRCSLLLTKEGV